MWLNGGVDPLNLSLEERVELYKIQYPKNRIKFDCSCASEYSTDYHNAVLLNKFMGFFFCQNLTIFRTSVEIWNTTSSSIIPHFKDQTF